MTAPSLIVVDAVKAKPIASPREGLCTATATLLRSLPSSMTVEAFVTTAEPRLDPLTRAVRTLLERAAAASGGKLTFFVSVTTGDDDAKQRAKEAGLVETEAGLGGIVLAYGAERAKIPVLRPDDEPTLEFFMASKIRELRDRVEGKTNRIGVLRGHGELSLSESNLVSSTSGQRPNLEGILRQYFAYHQLVDVDLAKTGEVPQGLSGLLVLQPEKDISDRELRAIDRFVMKGRPVAIVASAVNVARSDATMNAQLGSHGLDKLTSGYGIELREDVLLDFGSSYQVEVLTQSGPSKTVMPMLPLVRDAALDARSPVFFHLEEVAFPLASSLVLHPERQPAAALHVHARTSPRAMRETGAAISLSPFRSWKPKGTFAQYDLAASASGKLRSAFDPALVASAPARVLVIASSQFFANPLARAGDTQNDPSGGMAMMVPTGGDEQLQQLSMPYAQLVLTSTILVSKALLDWLAYDPELAECALAP